MILEFKRPGEPDDECDETGPERRPPTVVRGGRRREKIMEAAEEAAEAWLRRESNQRPHRDTYADYDETAEANDPHSPLRHLSRPAKLGSLDDDPTLHLPPRRPDVTFKAGFFSSIGRLFIWLGGGIRFLWKIGIDKLRGRDSNSTRAVHLRETFEWLGTTFIKIGQQLSMRLDLLPYEYTQELSKMLDQVPPMPARDAIKVIERANGKPLGEIFEQFDPNQIGSASVACVYQATLCGGQRVAVKVRRPGIGERLACDMRALGWMLWLAEQFVLRPGFTGNFLFELRTMLMEELDFVREARFTDLWRVRLRKIRQLRFCTSPRVYFDYSSTEVLVTEFVSGIWLTEILTALESNNLILMKKMEEMNIDRRTLARRILLVSRYGNFENIFFHADLHPANILIQPGNKVVLIDFGSCGSFTKRELIAWRRMFDAQSLNDVGSMVQAGMGVLEPLPAIDKDQFALRLEYVFWNDLYAIKSKKSEWWERISARLWIGFLKLAREFSIPMRLNTLRMIRAIMLADTIAARLDHDLDPYAEYRYYERGAGRRARRRTKKRMRRILGPSKWVRIETGVEAGLMAVYRLQRALYSIAYIRLLPMIGKAATFFYELAQTVTIVMLIASAIALYKMLRFYPDQKFFMVMWDHVINKGWFQIISMMFFAPSMRQTLYRLTDPEYDRRR